MLTNSILLQAAEQPGGGFSIIMIVALIAIGQLLIKLVCKNAIIQGG